jgi:hypothetical protein
MHGTLRNAASGIDVRYCDKWSGRGRAGLCGCREDELLQQPGSVKKNEARKETGGRAMSCKSCASSRQIEFRGEICLHFPGGLASLGKPLVWVYPQVIVCLDCGAAEFDVPQAELKLIREHQ